MQKVNAAILEMNEIRFAKLLHRSVDVHDTQAKCIGEHLLGQWKVERSLGHQSDHGQALVHFQEKMRYSLIGIVTAEPQQLISRKLQMLTSDSVVVTLKVMSLVLVVGRADRIDKMYGRNRDYPTGNDLAEAAERLKRIAWKDEAEYLPPSV
jgi:hypothetical protein